ncbi:hypothetical protein D3C86_1317520 [compost metagenome]
MIKLFCCFAVITPCCTTSAGSWLVACATLFCTLTAAWSASVPSLKKTVMARVPSLLAVELMYVMFSTPLMDSSSDGATERKTVSALAPG